MVYGDHGGAKGYLIGEEHFGPIGTENLRKAIASGQLSKETHVFRDGLSAWLHAVRR